MTTDRHDPNLRKIHESGPLKGQQFDYLVLSDEERAKGFVRPVRSSYIHLKCGGATYMGTKLAETYARDPHFYGGTMCVHCGTHFRLRDEHGEPAFLWEDGEPVGSDAEEALEYLNDLAAKQAVKEAGGGI